MLCLKALFSVEGRLSEKLQALLFARIANPYAFWEHKLWEKWAKLSTLPHFFNADEKQQEKACYEDQGLHPPPVKNKLIPLPLSRDLLFFVQPGPSLRKGCKRPTSWVPHSSTQHNNKTKHMKHKTTYKILKRWHVAGRKPKKAKKHQNTQLTCNPVLLGGYF